MKLVSKVFAVAMIMGLSLTSCSKDNDVADTPPAEPGFPPVEAPANPINVTPGTPNS